MPDSVSWLNVLFIAELFVHGEPAEVSASALDALLSIELEAVAVEESSGGKTGVGRNSRGAADRTQCRVDALVEASGNTTTGKNGMSEKKVEVAIVCVGSETRKNTVRLGDDGVKMRETLLPACGVRVELAPTRQSGPASSRTLPKSESKRCKSR